MWFDAHLVTYNEEFQCKLISIIYYWNCKLYGDETRDMKLICKIISKTNETFDFDLGAIERFMKEFFR